MPLQRRLPKFGFKPLSRTEYKAVNLVDLENLQILLTSRRSALQNSSQQVSSMASSPSRSLPTASSPKSSPLKQTHSLRLLRKLLLKPEALSIKFNPLLLEMRFIATIRNIWTIEELEKTHSRHSSVGARLSSRLYVGLPGISPEDLDALSKFTNKSGLMQL